MGEAVIKESTGNLLAAAVEALVNTVNTEGVMGKGIALQFKKAYPAMFDEYRKAAKAGEIRIGAMQVWETDLLEGPRFIINFPTKKHWKAKSRLADIDAGLVDLARVVADLGIKSIAVPPLGCGNGGLDWRDVEPRIRAAFDEAPDVDVLLFAPNGAPTAAEMSVATPRPAMNHNRAAFVDTLHRYTRQAEMAPGLIETQKLMYFLEVAGEPLKLQYSANRYGPYSDRLRHALSALEGHFISGIGDGSAAVQEAEPLTVLPGAAEEAEAQLDGALPTRERIQRVLALAQGFESAYGLELLASVHWVVARENARDNDIAARVSAWSPRKARMFTQMHVLTALNALRERGWLASAA